MLDSVVLVGMNAVVLGAVAFLAKSLISHLLDKDIREFQHAIEHKALLEVEKYKSELDLERLRLQIAYGGIYARQAEILVAMYEYIQNIEEAASAAIHNGGSAQERWGAFSSAFHDVVQYHLKNRILLPVEIDRDVSSFLQKIFRSVRQYIAVDRRDLSRLSEEQLNEAFHKQDSAADVVIKEVPQLREQLIDSTRMVLGVQLYQASKVPPSP